MAEAMADRRRFNGRGICTWLPRLTVLAAAVMMPGLALSQTAPPSPAKTATPSTTPPRCDADCVKSNLNKAAAACARPIEAQAPFDFDWLTRPFATLFQQADQSSSDDSVVRYRGDSIRFMTPQKEWIRVSYECAYDVAAQKVVTVLVRPGRLDKPNPPAVAGGGNHNSRTVAGAPNNALRPPSSATVYVDEPNPIAFTQVDPHRKKP
jgi:hypothetical protein